MEAVERGDEPSGLVRDPEQNQCIPWPHGLRRFYDAPVPTDAVRAKLAAISRVIPSLPDGERYFLIAGQPEHVREQWDYAMGLRDDPPTPVGEPVAVSVGGRTS